MSFNLQITIGGLCLLVPEKDSAGRPRSLHVLMPDTPPTGDHAHRPRLYYLKSYHDAGAGATEAHVIDLSGRDLDLSHVVSDTALNLDLSPEVFSFDRAPVPRVVPRTLIDWSQFPQGVRSRMRVNSGAELGDRILPGGIWDFEGQAIQMATAISWGLLNVPGNTLELSGAPGVLTAKDEGAGPAIRLFLLHLPEEETMKEIPPELPQSDKDVGIGEMACHFGYIYPLLRPNVPRSHPSFRRRPVLDPRQLAANFGSELTCMLASGPPG